MNRLMQSLKNNRLLLFLAGMSFVFGSFFYTRLPERVPSHWNFSGQVDGYSSRFWGAYGIPLMLLGFLVLFEILPWIDPRQANYPKFAKAYRAFKYAFTLFLVFIHLLVLLAGTGVPVQISLIVPMAVSLLFMVIGNYMTTIRQNYFFGIRTPWTLASEEVWQKTHRLGGRLWVAAGFFSLIGLLVNVRLGGILMIVLISATSIYAVGYSWWCFKNLPKSQ